MADTQTTGQIEVDAETARNAADILSIIADYEDEMDTVVGEPEEQAVARPSRAPLGQSQPTAPVRAKEPPQPMVEPRESEPAPTQPSERTSTEPQLDAQAEILRLQMDRAKQLQKDAAAARSEAKADEAGAQSESIYQTPVPPQVQTKQEDSPSPDLTPAKSQTTRNETTTVPSSQPGHEAFTHILEDIRSELHNAAEQRHAFAQQLTASQERIAHLEQKAESAPRVSPSGTTVSAVPKPVVSPVDEPTSVPQVTDNQILKQILTAQSTLVQEIKAIRGHSGNPLHPEGTPFEAMPQPEPCTLDTLAAELTRVKSHLNQLENGKTHLSNPVEAYTKQTHTLPRHDIAITQQIQDLRMQLEQTYGEREAMAETLTQTSQTTQCLRDKIRQQEKTLVEKGQQLNTLYIQRENETTQYHTQLADQADALSQAKQALHKEISQRREVENMLAEISSQFHMGR